MATMTDPRHEFELAREDDCYRVTATVDAAPEDVDVRWIDGRLHVTVEHHENGHTRVGTRDITVPRAVDPDGITASIEDGVLEVRLPTTGGTPSGRAVSLK